MSLTQKLKLLDNQTAAGATGTGQTQGPGDGPLFNLMYPQLASAVQAEFSGGAGSGVKILIMAKLDGATWDTIATLDSGAGYNSGKINAFTLPAPMLEVKANLLTNTGGGPVSCYLVAYG